MENRRNLKYYVLMVLFTVIFFFCMAFCFVRYRELAHEYKIQSVPYRLECAELDETMFGPSHIFLSLYFDYDYEEAFDSYWEFSDIYLTYVRGRFADDKAPYINKLQACLAAFPDGERSDAVKEYLAVLEKE